jgi:hypothetical protein
MWHSIYNLFPIGVWIQVNSHRTATLAKVYGDSKTPVGEPASSKYQSNHLREASPTPIPRGVN